MKTLFTLNRMSFIRRRGWLAGRDESTGICSDSHPPVSLSISTINSASERAFHVAAVSDTVASRDDESQSHRPLNVTLTEVKKNNNTNNRADWHSQTGGGKKQKRRYYKVLPYASNTWSTLALWKDNIWYKHCGPTTQLARQIAPRTYFTNRYECLRSCTFACQRYSIENSACVRSATLVYS